MSPEKEIIRPFTMNIDFSTQKINIFKSNIVSGTIDIKVKVTSKYTTPRLNLWMRKDPLSNEENIYNTKGINFKDNQLLTLTIPFEVPVNDDILLCVSYNVVHYDFKCPKDMLLNYLLPTIEQYVDIVCHRATQLRSNCLILFFKDQKEVLYEMTLYPRDLPDSIPIIY
ncbi:hypothetical protein PPL_02624 [Heterostelium album PN500]|uniref:Uncharacterized protein n=1 Tax=Heterostelium pallidum (strain ATCC 26659 / Pp 5 / PN500) TaxID=670386 RepID=D3B2L0_HETP5|nr:hypothetical protein PPL_02624 [Heterostelium album PN500]EFA83558.1 hypothetical protein PPL_02624 [Heterostelium album PN500]|eukprot:XP_020435675.1 hypothetical protein PPL_02624 [Heterostelium album PN500]